MCRFWKFLPPSGSIKKDIKHQSRGCTEPSIVVSRYKPLGNGLSAAISQEAFLWLSSFNLATCASAYKSPMCEVEHDLCKLIGWCDYFPLLIGTSVIAGIAIFSILGHMAHIYGKPVGEVVKEGQTPIMQVFLNVKKKLLYILSCYVSPSLCRIWPRIHCISRRFS